MLTRYVCWPVKKCKNIVWRDKHRRQQIRKVTGKNFPRFADDTKPEETRLISETAGLFSPEMVAKGILRDAVRGEFFSTVGLDGFILGEFSIKWIFYEFVFCWYKFFWQE